MLDFFSYTIGTEVLEKEIQPHEMVKSLYESVVVL